MKPPVNLDKIDKFRMQSEQIELTLSAVNNPNYSYVWIKSTSLDWAVVLLAVIDWSYETVEIRKCIMGSGFSGETLCKTGFSRGDMISCARFTTWLMSLTRPYRLQLDREAMSS